MTRTKLKTFVFLSQTLQLYPRFLEPVLSEVQKVGIPVFCVYLTTCQSFSLSPGVYLMKLIGLCRPAIIAMILLPFLDSLVSYSYSKSHANQFFEVHKGEKLFLPKTYILLNLILRVQVWFFSFFQIVCLIVEVFFLMIYTPILRLDVRLVGHAIETLITNELNCGLRCARNMKCQSFNCHSDGQHDNKICELNDRKGHAKPKDLIPVKGFTYYEKGKKATKVSLRERQSFYFIRDLNTNGLCYGRLHSKHNFHRWAFFLMNVLLL